MSKQSLLNYQFHQLKQAINQPTLVFIHGLFGDMNNLGTIARAFSEHYPILRVDLRNHGQSFHSHEMNYDLMAQDLANLIHHLQLNKVILIGHSMGGKTAMKMAAFFPDLVEKLIVIDIAPIQYAHNGHDNVFAGLLAVNTAQVQTRQEAKKILATYISEEAVQQFMLKSFDNQSPESFRFNLSALRQNYAHLMDWQNCYVKLPTLFIRGGLSHYIQPENTAQILAQFPNATSFTINGCGHWVHAEKPDFVIRAIERFLISNK
ncbi:alpha/beta fold hydrolase [Pasteurella canis]|uniref:alpha/beta fold hydrolase n=1 Tax=Pasteurella canis TaxID=753 RepID=UPI000664E949|nr:alpha/beta fold hydrolase [Pasteurella canis]UAX42638.1 alpha/beta fold hydrolase [Pasteurella canis]